jgi:hypothetical protein
LGPPRHVPGARVSTPDDVRGAARWTAVAASAGASARVDIVGGVTPHAWHILLTLLGVGFEVVGLSWLVANASRERGDEFGEYGVLRRIRNWLVYWLGPAPEPVTLNVSAAGSASATGHLSLRTSNETEIERLQRELQELRDRVQRHETQTAQHLSAVEENIQRTGAGLTERIEQIAGRQRELHRVRDGNGLRGPARADQ